MNKTININLGGFFFHIDETAYQKLKRYLDAIALSLSNDPQGKDEIIADIEARISELLLERITDARQVVNNTDIDDIITIMGQPEDYTDTEDTFTDSSSSKRKTNVRKLFRDGNDKFLGGVASGLSHYFNIDVIWVRIAFIALTFGFGFSPLVYIMLWILLPEAKTTSEKLQMEGEDVNIDNIEKKIRDEFNYFSSKIKDGASELGDKVASADYEKLRNQTKSGLHDFLNTLGKITTAIFNIFGKFIGVLLMLVAAIVLLSLIIGGFSIGSLEFINIGNNITYYPAFFYDSILPKWILILLFLIVIGIPFLILFILGLRIISSSINKLTKTTSLTLLGVWILAVFGLTFTGIEYGTTKAYDGLKVTKSNLPFNSKDTIHLKVVNNDELYYRHNFRRRKSHHIVDFNGKEKSYCNNVKIDVQESDINIPFIEVKKYSEGKNRREANEYAKEILYQFNTTNNEIILNGYFLSSPNNLYKDESVLVTIYIPKGTTIFFTHSSKHFLYQIDNTENIYDKDMINHYFKMGSKGFYCTDCYAYETYIEEKKNNKPPQLKSNDNRAQIEF
ncbi:PspC domain-containing protein [Tenacibaculum maritimum]|uniref:PspC domain-containing protein n=1 Tax=Tenacibaculum maritimum TaxID=107401 RepID=UPI001E4054F4|nr:PspC domain-containing protein [Tenacibaculum maritimum]MCD9585475.1 PspC domain-containing protein [Tenacibaculum maritimum]MCD9621408.1 PspC domain-containing protein [Tenacibaculum maritimum]MCD9627898.1 PspC domain-containing protein [Tenacibaculum maritimum]MCD9631109.1 PspC domain-containing protein [Tenacibaculum maritimum]MCD9633058.1 PspC domain-containing protein [Tenacibaculum maritimum]